jgi:hypothetical protein
MYNLKIMFNLSFFYKNIGRFILFLQFSINRYSFKQMIKLNSLIIYFNLIDLKDLDQMAISNYFYFFRYFFGILPYFTNYQHKFHLNIHYYSFFLQYYFKKFNIYNYLNIFLNDIYFKINKLYIELNNTLKIFEFIIVDMNFFIEKKNTLGFFSLIDSVKFKFLFSKNLEIKYLNLIFLFKLKI